MFFIYFLITKNVLLIHTQAYLAQHYTAFVRQRNRTSHILLTTSTEERRRRCWVGPDDVPLMWQRVANLHVTHG